MPKDENVFFSPASVRIALAMTYAGARGGTAREMANVLALGPDAAQTHRGFARALADYADADSSDAPANASPAEKANAEKRRQTLRVVNRLWGQKGHTFDQSFAALVAADYAAPLVGLDFAGATDESRRTINAFIAAQTEERIQDLIPAGALDPRTRLVLTNAVYFKGTWRGAFAPGATQNAPFFVSPSRTVQAPLMTQTSHFRYGSVGDAQVLELPYDSDRLAMVVVLPKTRGGLPALERAMNEGAIRSWTASLGTATVHVTLPRFTMKTHFSLRGALAAMGMPSAFDAHAADFSGMDGTKSLVIGDVLHEAFVAVDEKGTEAAAASAVDMTLECDYVVTLPPPIEFRADHPFLFFVKEKETGSVLFMGRVTEPTGNGG
jgi:serpin B